MVRSIQCFVDNMQYANGGCAQYANSRYAVRKKTLISYADLKLYTKILQFLNRNTTNVLFIVKTLKLCVRSLGSRICSDILSLTILKQGLLRSQNQQLWSEHIITYVCQWMTQTSIFIFFIEKELAKTCFVLFASSKWSSTKYARDSFSTLIQNLQNNRWWAVGDLRSRINCNIDNIL